MQKEVLPKKETKILRLQYSSPTLSEFGDLHKLTHGDINGTWDGDPAFYGHQS